MSEKARIGWIGTGVMGHSMAGHLQNAGYQLTVFNRTPAKCQSLVDKGAVLAASPREVGEKSDIVFSIVGYPRDVREVLIGPDGALSGMAGRGGIICDMTTSSPTLAVEIAEAAAAAGCASLDAPVTGGDVGARNASLSIFVGGDKAAYDKVLPLLRIMGQKIMHCGGPGTGQHGKLANQAAIAGVMFSVCESIIYARSAGLDVRQWLDLVAAGAAGSAAMKNLGPRMLDGNFDPGFFIEHFVKDLKLLEEECDRMELTLPATQMALDHYSGMANQGKGRLGTQALITELSEISAREWTPVPRD